MGTVRSDLGPWHMGSKKCWRPPGFQQEAQKIQVLHLVSYRSQRATLSLPQLY